MEGIIVIVGLCLTFLPIILYCNYLLKHVTTKTNFDIHLEMVSSKKGILGKIVAYLDKILFTTTICSFGLWMSEAFTEKKLLIIFVISLILYIIVKYFDEKFEK